MIKLFHHHVYPEAIDNVVKTLQSGWTGLGPMVTKFEEELQHYLNTPFVIATNSGTSALQMALMHVNQARNSELWDNVITSPLTFIGAVHTIINVGLQPMFADIDPQTGLIDPTSVEKLLSIKEIRDNTRAIIATHYGGQPCDLDELYDMGLTYNIDIIEDAAHAFGAAYRGKKEHFDFDLIGTKFSKYVCFSFHSVKVLAIGDGGALATNNTSVAEFGRLWRWFGITKSTNDRTVGTKYTWDYDVELIGHKAHMNDIKAAIGLGQLKHIQEDLEYRQQLVLWYIRQLQDLDEIKILTIKPDRRSANHLFVILCENNDIRDKLMDFLREFDIQTGCHYRPAHLHPIYKGFITDDGCPNSVNFYERAISLPMHVKLSLDDVTFVCEKIRQFFRR